MCVCACVLARARMYVRACARTYVCECVYVRVCVYVLACECVCVWVGMLCVCVRAMVCVYMCTFVCVAVTHHPKCITVLIFEIKHKTVCFPICRHDCECARNRVRLYFSRDCVFFV